MTSKKAVDHLLIWLSVAILLAAGARAQESPSQTRRAMDPRAAAVRYLIAREIDHLARQGLPRPAERLAFCLGTTKKAGAKGKAPTTSLEAFLAELRDVRDPPEWFVKQVENDAYDLFGAEGCEQNGMGGWFDRTTGRGTRGLVEVGPAYQIDEDHVEVPIQILTGILAAEGFVLELEVSRGVWQVVRQRFVWGA